jgi:transposase-like protein
MADLKRVYTASTEEIARLESDAFAEKWDDKYPTICYIYQQKFLISNWHCLLELTIHHLLPSG